MGIITNFVKQECIPVGCIPSAAVAGGGGVSQHVLDRGVSAQTGCVCPGGVCSGVSVQGGGVCLEGVCPSACWDTPPLPGQNS